MKVAVIGAKGMLGQELCRLLGAGHEILAWDIDEIDITDRPQTLGLLSAERPGLIVNAAAFVDVDGCEAEPDRAWRINAAGAQNLALAAQRLESALLYISSDYIFDGNTETDYDEVSQPNPINQYGRSKLAGEMLSLWSCPRTYVVRSAWLLGHRPHNYVDRVLDQAEQEGVVRLAEDQIESPTYVSHLAEAIAKLIALEAYGLYHITSIGACTRTEFASFVLRQAGRSEPVEPVDGRRLGRLAHRPYRTVLNCRLFQLVTGHRLPHWQEGVQAFFTHRKAALADGRSQESAS